MVIAANATLMRLVSSWTSFEIAIGAVTRLKDVQDTIPQEEILAETLAPEDSWPQRGDFVLKDVRVSYKYVFTGIALTCN